MASPTAVNSSSGALQRGLNGRSSFRNASETGYNTNSSSSPSPSSTTPSMADIELAGQVRQLFFQARAARRPLVAQWNRNYRIMRNRTWADGRSSYLPAPEVPEIYPIIASLVGWETDQRPSFEVAPFTESGSPYYQYLDDLAHDLQTVMQSVWDVEEFEAEVEQVCWDGFVYGTGIFKTGWDGSLDGGLGNASLRRIDPYTFYPDPQATSMRDANYFIEARTMSLQEMDRKWPGSADKLRQGGFTEDVDTAPTGLDNSSMPRANPGAIPPVTTPRYGLPGQSRITHPTSDPGVTVFEAWLREHYTIPDPGGPSADDTTGTAGHVHVDDCWRVVVVAGNLILMDEQAKDVWSHGQHPYERYVPHRTGEFWGLSLVEMLAPSQLSINRLLAALQLNVELTGNPVFKESTRAGITRTKLTNKPGQRLQMNEGGTAEWLAPPLVSPMMSDLIKFYIQEMERISGLSAITRGGSPPGRNSQGVMDSIQEASFVRIRMALRNLEWALRSCGEKIAAVICENYTEPRMVAVTGPQTSPQAKALRGNHFYLPTPEGRVPMRFQLNVTVGSQQATSRQARVAEADALFAMGALDIPAILEAHDWPNRGVVGPRVMEQLATGSMQPPGARQRTGRSS